MESGTKHSAERNKKRRKTFHSWLDLEAQVTRGDEEEEDAWEIGEPLERRPSPSLTNWT